MAPPAPASAVPALDTARLTLRAHALADVAECTAMWADPQVTRHIGGRALSGEEVWARVLRYAGLWALLGYGYWVVRERASGRFMGEVGLADFRRELTPPLGEALAGAPEVGWVLATWAQGRGYATEAVRGALAWADAQAGHPVLGRGRTVCLIAPRNEASVRVAEKCGFRRAADAAYRGEPTLVFGRDATPEPRGRS